MAKILLVEDDRDTAQNVRDFLNSENHVVDVVYNGEDADFRLDTYDYELVVLDVILPDKTGFEILKRYRSRGGRARIIMLTGQTEVSDKECGLDSGADDYLTKPFHPRELSARIRSLMRRDFQEKGVTKLLRVRDLELDPSTREVKKAGKPVDLLPKEFELLEFLMKAPGEVFSQEAIHSRVWEDENVSIATVRVHVRKVREKIDDDKSDSYIQTVHRQGYKIE